MFEKLRIVGWDIKDQGDVQYETVEKDEPTKWGMKRSRLCGGANKALAEMMYPLLKDGNFCLNLGGDHSTAAGSLAAVLKVNMIIMNVIIHFSILTNILFSIGKT